jgi:hypothetical protein
MSDRGSAEFYTQKGFLDEFSVKQVDPGHSPETLPPEEGADVTEGAEVDNVDVNAPKGANIKASDNKTGDTSTTMAKDLAEVQAKAEEDIADGYISDVQHLPGPGDREKKGFEQFNDMVAKGVVVETQGLNRWNIDQAVDQIVDIANKEFDTTVHDEFGGWMSKTIEDDMVTYKGLSAQEMVMKMEGNVSPEDEEANEGLTEDSEAVGSTDEESDMDEGKQGENSSKPQTKAGDSFSEEGATEEKGWAKDAAKYVGRKARYYRKRATSAAMRGGKKVASKAREAKAGGVSSAAGSAGEGLRKAGSYLNKNKYAIGGGALAGGVVGEQVGRRYNSDGSRRKGLEDTIVAKSFVDGSDVMVEKGARWEAVKGGAKRAGQYIADSRVGSAGKKVGSHFSKHGEKYAGGALVGAAGLGISARVAHDRGLVGGAKAGEPRKRSIEGADIGRMAGLKHGWYKFGVGSKKAGQDAAEAHFRKMKKKK